MAQSTRAGKKGRAKWVVVFVLAAAAGGWLGWKPAWTWYCLRGLAAAGDGDRAAWAERVGGLGDAAVPGLLDSLRSEDARTCGNATAGLAALSRGWGLDDPRSRELYGRLADAFPHLSAAGQECLLRTATEWLCGGTGKPPAALVEWASQLSGHAAGVADAAARAAGLELAARLLGREEWQGALGSCRELVRACLADASGPNRKRAVELAAVPALDVSEQAAPLLADADVEVRRAAVLALGGSRQAVNDEALAVALHDPDPEVRRLCSAALRGRGLTAEHIQMARLVTDRRPAVRMEVLYHLHEGSDLDVGLWLRRLSLDPSEAVRLAAVRAAAEQELHELSDRLEEMARRDPSPTVCQWARYYLGRQKHREARLGE